MTVTVRDSWHPGTATTRTAVGADFADLAEAGSPVISPDGRRVAFASLRASTGPAVALHMAAASGADQPGLLADDVQLLAGPCWSPDSSTLGFVDRCDGEPVFIWIGMADGAGGRVRLPETAQGATQVFWLRAGGPVVALLSMPHGQLWAVDPSTGTARALTPAGLDVVDAAPSPDGIRIAVLVAAAERDGPATLCVVDALSGEVVRTLSAAATTPTSRDRTLSWSPDGSLVLFSSGDPRRGHEPAVVPANGGAVRHIWSRREGTVLKAEWTTGGRVVAQVFRRTRAVLAEIDLDGGEPIELCETGMGYPRFSSSVGTGRLAFLAGDEFLGPDVWVRDLDGSVRRLTELNPGLAGLDMCAVEELTWVSSADGALIHGLLVRPSSSPEPLPTVVALHGGPHYHWCAGWLGSWVDWAQLLASNGFAVFLPNPRGSTGRDWQYAHAVRGAIGTLPLGDVLDGVDMLVDIGVADRERLGVGGWSYGGFLAAWAVTQTDRFRAAVVGAGIADFYSFVGSSPMGPTWRGFVPGSGYPDRGTFDLASPVTHLRRCTTPTLVAHGEKDRKISVEQGLMLHRGLRELGVPTELVMLSGEGHVISSVEARERLLDAILEWFGRHLRC